MCNSTGMQIPWMKNHRTLASDGIAKKRLLKTGFNAGLHVQVQACSALAIAAWAAATRAIGTR